VDWARGWDLIEGGIPQPGQKWGKGHEKQGKRIGAYKCPSRTGVEITRHKEMWVDRRRKKKGNIWG
jgi:hypothetical protein